jgi:hypothetical protein
VGSSAEQPAAAAAAVAETQGAAAAAAEADQSRDKDEAHGSGDGGCCCHWEVMFGKVAVRSEPDVTSIRRSIKLKGMIVVGTAMECPKGGCHWVRLAAEGSELGDEEEEEEGNEGECGGYMLSEDPVEHGVLLRKVEQPS